jgi:UDP-galactopyranose mutase
MHTTRPDFTIVGAGITGATLARLLHDAGHSVLVLERRGHVGGNVSDHIDGQTGLWVHDHGPHLFRTSSDRIWSFVQRFGAFHAYRHRVLSDVGGSLFPWPLGRSTLTLLEGEDPQPALANHHTAQHLEEAALSLMPRVVYETFVKPYNEKQWGVPAAALEADLCKRFDVREDDNLDFTPHAKYQALPVNGYRSLVEQMLQGIDVRLGHEVSSDRGGMNLDERFRPQRRMFFSGPIDVYFGRCFGALRYRCQGRNHQHTQQRLGAAVINNPLHSGGAHVRTIDWSWLNPWTSTTTTLWTTETPREAVVLDELEYPFPSSEQRALYERYRALATDPMVVFCGRLGEYRYLDMDQAIGRAMLLAEHELNG